MSLILRIEPDQIDAIRDAILDRIKQFREEVPEMVSPWALKNVPDSLYVTWFESMLAKSTVTPWLDPQGQPLPPVPDWLLMLAEVRGGPDEIKRYTRLKQKQQEQQVAAMGPQPFDPMAQQMPSNVTPFPQPGMASAGLGGGTTFSNLSSSLGAATGQPAGIMATLGAQGVA